MKQYFRIAHIDPIQNMEEGITVHSFIVYSIKNERIFTFIVTNTGYDLSIIKEGDVIQFESRENLSARTHKSILFEVRPNLETFNERDIFYRSVKDSNVFLIVEKPNILTFPIVKFDDTKRNRKISTKTNIFSISIEKNFFS